jgi:hypothetical protein
MARGFEPTTDDFHNFSYIVTRATAVNQSTARHRPSRAAVAE